MSVPHELLLCLKKMEQNGLITRYKTYSFPKSYVSYRKPRAVSTEQRERTRQMMIANNKAKGD